MTKISLYRRIVIGIIVINVAIICIVYLPNFAVNVSHFHKVERLQAKGAKISENFENILGHKPALDFYQNEVRRATTSMNSIENKRNVADKDYAVDEKHQEDLYSITEEDMVLEEEFNGRVISSEHLDPDEEEHLLDARVGDSNVPEIIPTPTALPKRELPSLLDIKHKLLSVPHKQKAVLILTSYRSGSSFLGQLFNQHPGVFYTFEPLYPFLNVPRNKWEDGPVTLLKRYLECNIPQMEQLYQHLNISASVINKNDKKCLDNNICFRYCMKLLNPDTLRLNFRYDSKSLCERDMCPNGNITRCSNCGLVSSTKANEKCKKRISVSKVIRIYDLAKLRIAMEDPALDLKVILLYRDPRAVANSRAKINPTWNLGKNLKSYCDVIMHNVQIGKQEWIKNKIKLIRYEDLALYPFKKAEELLSFTGLKFVYQVRKWITENTKPPDNARERLWYQTHSEAYKPTDDHYSTMRDAKTAINAWRESLNISTVLDIQDSCKSFMKFGNYKRVWNQDDLRNFNMSPVTL